MPCISLCEWQVVNVVSFQFAVVNINIPRLSDGEPKGVKVLPHSTSGYYETFDARLDEDGQTLYHYTGGGHREAEATSTDTEALKDGFMTVTALRCDMTDFEKEFQALLKELGDDAERMPKNLSRLVYTHGVLIGIKIGTELLDIAKQIIDKKGE